VANGLLEVRLGLGDAQGQGHGFLPRVLQAATVQGKEAGQGKQGLGSYQFRIIKEA
jgi:hypothetical protein